MTRQLALDLPVRPALGRADFLVASSNAAALAMLDGWRDWPAGRLVLTGPAGSGKTHLAHVWAAAAAARVVPAARVTPAAAPGLAGAPLAVEDADRGRDEAGLFHLLNLAAERGTPVLVTAAVPPARWTGALPDLVSRLAAAPLARLEPPDDALLQAVIVKLFADRGLEVRPALVPWLAARIERSLAAAADAVDRLDRAALAEARPVGRALATRVLDFPAGPATCSGA